jgi:GTP-binding protein
MNLPKVVITGRPNVGKSTLFNRIVARQIAIVEKSPKVTRDRIEKEVTYKDHRLVITDTGGWLLKGEELDKLVNDQVKKALLEGDVIIVVVDAKTGIIEDDISIINFAKKLDKPLILCFNKTDNQKDQQNADQYSTWGIKDTVKISAAHGRGISDLMSKVLHYLPEASFKNDTKEITVSIVGLPNAGKSSLFNRLLKTERSIVFDRPGTTRDTVDSILKTEFGDIRFLDTAGLKRKLTTDVEYYASIRATDSYLASDICLYVIDSTHGITHYDQTIIKKVEESGSPIILLFNKWDLTDNIMKKELKITAIEKLGFISYASRFGVSAKTGYNVKRIIPEISKVLESYNKRIPTHILNKAIKTAQANHQPKMGKIMYVTQGAINPPTFILFSTNSLDKSYLRYIQNYLRAEFNLDTAIKIRVKSKK